MSPWNCYEDRARAAAYAGLGFSDTYYLAYRDLPEIICNHVAGRRAVDFGCGSGRSTRFLQGLGFQVTGIDISVEMVDKAQQLDPEGDYRVVADGDYTGLGATCYDLVLSVFTSLYSHLTTFPAQREGRFYSAISFIAEGRRKGGHAGFNPGIIWARLGIFLNQPISREPKAKER